MTIKGTIAVRLVWANSVKSGGYSASGVTDGSLSSQWVTDGKCNGGELCLKFSSCSLFGAIEYYGRSVAGTEKSFKEVRFSNGITPISHTFSDTKDLQTVSFTTSMSGNYLKMTSSKTNGAFGND